MSNNELVLLRRIEELEKLIQRQPEVGGVWQDWTPKAEGLTSPSYAIQTGKYTQIGEVVFGYFILRINSWTGQSGLLRITPPPIGTMLIGSGSYFNNAYSKPYGRRIEKYLGYIIFMNDNSSGAENWTGTALVELKGNFIGY